MNLVISAENEGLSNAGQIVFTYSSRACVHRISVLLDLLAVKVKLFHWRWTSRDTWCGTNCWSGRASSTVQFRYTEVGIQTFLRTLMYTPTTSLRRFLDQPLSWVTTTITAAISWTRTSWWEFNTALILPCNSCGICLVEPSPYSWGGAGQGSVCSEACCSAVHKPLDHCVHYIVAAASCALQCKAVESCDLYCTIIMNINELVRCHVICSCCSLCKTEIELAWWPLSAHVCNYWLNLRGQGKQLMKGLYSR